MASRSYRPGDWFGIFGEQATVVLPPSEKSRVAALWALVDDGRRLRRGARRPDRHRAARAARLRARQRGRRETKVVIRGAARAVFTTDDETVTVEGSSATTWAERSLSGVRTMRIEVADSDGTTTSPSATAWCGSRAPTGRPTTRPGRIRRWRTVTLDPTPDTPHRPPPPAEHRASSRAGVRSEAPEPETPSRTTVDPSAEPRRPSRPAGPSPPSRSPPLAPAARHRPRRPDARARRHDPGGQLDPGEFGNQPGIPGQQPHRACWPPPSPG